MWIVGADGPPNVMVAFYALFAVLGIASCVSAQQVFFKETFGASPANSHRRRSQI
jgi:hypothetical protein